MPMWHDPWLIPPPTPDKMAAVLADGMFKCIFLNKNDNIPIEIYLFIYLLKYIYTG